MAEECCNTGPMVRWLATVPNRTTTSQLKSTHCAVANFTEDTAGFMG